MSSTNEEAAAHRAVCHMCRSIREVGDRRLIALREAHRAARLTAPAQRAAALREVGRRDQARIEAAAARREAVRAHPNYWGGGS